MTGHDRATEAQPSGADAPPPLAPRGLKAAVVVMGLLLIVGFIALFATIVYRAVAPARQAAGFGQIEAPIARQGRIGALHLDGDRLAVEVAGPEGAEIILFDVRRGRELGRIRLKPQ